MSIQRFIHPSIWTSEDFASLDPWARLLFIGCFSTADDEGRRKASPASLKAEIFPLDDHKLSDISTWTRQVADMGLIRVWSGPDDVLYLELPKWADYQKPKYKKKSRIPKYDPDRVHTWPIPSPDEDQTCSVDRVGRDRVGRDSGRPPPTPLKKGERTFPVWFDELWDLYPGRDKTPTYEKCKRLTEGGEPIADLIAAAKHYRDDKDRKPDFTKSGERFYGRKGHWKDYVNGCPSGEKDQGAGEAARKKANTDQERTFADDLEAAQALAEEEKR